MTSDKKSDDFVVRIPGDRSNSFQEEKDPFLARTPSHKVSQPGLHDKVVKVKNSPGVSIMAYCLSSISMTVVNKYCVSGKNWNLNLFYLAVQSIVCIGAILVCKKMGMIKNLAPFDKEKARKCTFESWT